MSSIQNPQKTLGDTASPPGGGAVTAKISQKAKQEAIRTFQRILQPNDTFEEIRESLKAVWFTVWVAHDDGGDPNIKGRLRNQEEFLAYVEHGSQEQRKLFDLLTSMAKNLVPWDGLFENEAFLKPVKSPDLDLAHATRLAWGGKFKGKLANVLYDTIADFLDQDRNPYARLTSIVNSSGTGKSRVVDELGREVITVPMCLRLGSEGFPPPDRKLRDWLIVTSSDRGDAQKTLHAFIFSLLTVTQSELETIASDKKVIPKLPRRKKTASEAAQRSYMSAVIARHKKLASIFREAMTTGQSCDASNSYRECFYIKVIEQAKQFVGKSKHTKDGNEPEHGRFTSEEGMGPRDAGERLCWFIDPRKVLRPATGPRRPLVVLVFDEAHILTDNPQHQTNWNLFSELRRILRQINDLPIFSVFLSTARRFEKFSPEIRSDFSVRARDPDNRPLSPITEISFDDIAYPALKDTVTMKRVVDIDWISHLGRPLFGSYWDHLPLEIKNELTIIDYAGQKLLNGPNQLRGDNSAGTLACLSVRFALEFNMDVSARDVSHTQVERHMRLCIAATVGLEKMITISGSEPLLAEAAYRLMKSTKKSAVRHLAEHSDLNSIDRGRRGELVATLLIMQAYDAARAISNGRCVSVANFMEALLPASKYKTLLGSRPSSLPMDSDTAETFEEIFKDYGLWFNHVIKIEKKEMISIDHLWKFVTRGAMILCATGQEGIDIVLPVHYLTQNLGPSSVTAVVVQVKNAERHTDALSPALFDGMDSVIKSLMFSSIGVDSVPDSDSEVTSGPAEPPEKKQKTQADLKPVVRLVFSLASPKPAVVFRARPGKRHHPDLRQLTTFDIWLAGLSSETFRPVQENDLQSYKQLLERSLMPHDAFKLREEPNEMGKAARQARGPCRRRLAPLAIPGCSHNSIHIPDPSL